MPVIRLSPALPVERKGASWGGFVSFRGTLRKLPVVCQDPSLRPPQSLDIITSCDLANSKLKSADHWAGITLLLFASCKPLPGAMAEKKSAAPSHPPYASLIKEAVLSLKVSPARVSRLQQLL